MQASISWSWFKKTILLLMIVNLVFPVSAFADMNGAPDKSSEAHKAIRTATPIRHVIVVIGENRSFDNLFATYQPRGDQQVQNLLSSGIVNEDGNPGPNYNVAMQQTASDTQMYNLSPSLTGPFMVLPVPNTTYAPTIPWAITNPRSLS